MKKYLMIIAVLFSFGAQAQTIGMTGSHYGLALDTLVNTETMYLTTGSLSAYRTGKVAIQLDATNKTGTTTITAVLQSSLDGVTWANHFKTPGTTGVHCDTLAISGTTTHIYDSFAGAVASYAGTNQVQYSNAGRRLYFRIKLVGGATGTTQVKSKLITSE